LPAIMLDCTILMNCKHWWKDQHIGRMSGYRYS